MCVVSMIGDHYDDKWKPRPWYDPLKEWPSDKPVQRWDFISRKESDDLKREVAELKELLKRAKDYDERNDEPDCEIEEKMVLLRKVAELVGIDLDDVLAAKAVEN